MSWRKNLKIWAFSILFLFSFCSISVAEDSKKEVEVINDRFLRIDGKVYGYSSKDKFVKMKTAYEKYLNLKRQNELLKKKIENKNKIIESKNNIISYWKEHAQFMDKSFQKLEFSESKTQRVFDKVVDVVLPVGTFVIGAKVGSEVN